MLSHLSLPFQEPFILFILKPNPHKMLLWRRRKFCMLPMKDCYLLSNQFLTKEKVGVAEVDNKADFGLSRRTRLASTSSPWRAHQKQLLCDDNLLYSVDSKPCICVKLLRLISYQVDRLTGARTRMELMIGAELGSSH
ncbi:hypothetical protein QL285_020827 [Trifolium repens]|nr:hypothetical protein QL285_020827 [Trifolium repens]